MGKRSRGSLRSAPTGWGCCLCPQVVGGCHAWFSAEVVLRESRTLNQARLPDCSVLLLEGAGELCPQSCGGSHSVLTGPLGRRPGLSRKVGVKLLLGPHFQVWSYVPPMSYVPSCSGFYLGSAGPRSFPGGSAVKNLPPTQEPQEMWVQSLGWKDSLEEGMTTHSNILAWGIPWTEEPGRL